MRYLSLFSGIEAATKAWSPLGWEAVAFSEIEQFPCAVLDHHYPNTPNLGDVTKITEQVIKELGQIDVIIFGSPCQDLSVAGLRRGLDGERSGLFNTAMQIVEWAKRNNGARFALWENVPGAFSSNEGRDFAVVIGEMVGFTASVPQGGWQNSGIAIGENGLLEWSVLDAKHFGVPQRRRRVFAVADFGAWESRQSILLERGCVSGNFEAGEKEREDFAETFGANASESVYKKVGCVDVAPSLTSSGPPFSRTGNSRVESDALVCGYREGGFGDYVENEVGTLKASGGVLGGGSETFACLPIHSKATRHGENGCMNGMGIGEDGDPSPTLTTGDNHAVAYEMMVRRLTPIECERLQGFEDDYTKIPYRGKSVENCPDSPRYKALGNSMAVPVMKWIGQQINKAKTAKA